MIGHERVGNVLPMRVQSQEVGRTKTDHISRLHMARNTTGEGLGPEVVTITKSVHPVRGIPVRAVQLRPDPCRTPLRPCRASQRAPNAVARGVDGPRHGYSRSDRDRGAGAGERRGLARVGSPGLPEHHPPQGTIPPPSAARSRTTAASRTSLGSSHAPGSSSRMEPTRTTPASPEPASAATTATSFPLLHPCRNLRKRRGRSRAGVPGRKRLRATKARLHGPCPRLALRAGGGLRFAAILLACSPSPR